MHTEKGFSLIEVLVTLVLTAVGVLGMFALQSKSIGYTTDNVHREAAVSAAEEFLQLMRAYQPELFLKGPHKGAAMDFYYDLDSSTPLYKSDGKPNFAKSDCNSGTGSKQAAGCWLQRYEDQLPDFKVEKLCPSFEADKCHSKEQGSSVLIQLTWASRGESLCENQTCSYSLRAEL